MQKTAFGTILAIGSGIVGATDGANPVVVYLGIASGIAIGLVGIVQKLRDHELTRLLNRNQCLYDESEKLHVRIAELEATNARKQAEAESGICPYSVDGQAYCFNKNGPRHQFVPPTEADNPSRM